MLTRWLNPKLVTACAAWRCAWLRTESAGQQTKRGRAQPDFPIGAKCKQAVSGTRYGFPFPLPVSGRPHHRGGTGGNGGLGGGGGGGGGVTVVTVGITVGVVTTVIGLVGRVGLTGLTPAVPG
jgi:hypothetical protein